MPRMGLQARFIVVLLAVSLVPFAITVWAVRDIALSAQSVAVGQADRLGSALDKSAAAYREALAARKEVFQRSSDLVARDPRVVTACGPEGTDESLRPLLEEHAQLERVELVRDTGVLSLSRGTRLPGAPRPLSLTQEREVTPGCRAQLRWATLEGAALTEDLRSLGQILKDQEHLEKIRKQLPAEFRDRFLLILGGIVLVAITVAVVFARHTTRRVRRIVEGTRRVGEGDLSTRVGLAQNDEIGDLSRAFDDMVAEIAASRAEIEYLQKIGAWQEVARRLAHEIKNPLTPIQLAMQELFSKYEGDDARYKRRLDLAREVVTEEITGLRRLVDDFSAFARMPKVDPRRLDLAVVVEDVAREPAADGAAPLETAAPAKPVEVAGDRLLLRKAVANLVSNAREAGAKKVRVAWRADDGVAVMTIDDDGPGVPAAMVTKVFDPYVTGKATGTGLGLAIVKKTILDHGGSIALAPEKSPLGGARFVIQLPAAVGEEPPPASTPSAAP